MFSIDECMNYMVAIVNPKSHIFTPNWIIVLDIKSFIKGKKKIKKKSMINRTKKQKEFN